jgi:hypothetical protein
MAIKHFCEINVIETTFDEHKQCNARTEIKDKDSGENINCSIYFILQGSNLIMTAHFYILFV